MILRRRGQLGKLVTSFPVMIGIFLVMGLYIFLAAGASVNKPDRENFDFVSYSFEGEDLLLREVKFDGGNVLVFDVLYNSENVDFKVNSPLYKRPLKDMFEGIMEGDSGENICLAIEVFDGKEGNKDLFLRKTHEFAAEIPGNRGAGFYSNLLKSDDERVRKFLFTGKDEVSMKISYYYGRCIDE